ncbi:MAG: endopeptidase La [Oscillospiraceae bacterium]|nr:endopeptidase La [Oscillospiraceae bacterium]
MENPNYEFEQSRELPMMALRGLTVFPGMLLNFDVERPMSIASLNQAMGEDQVIFLAAQKEMATDVPTPDDVYAVGTVCRIKQMMKQPGNKTIRVMVEGLVRGQIAAVTSTSPGFLAVVNPLPDAEERSTARVEALIRHCCNLFDDYVHASGNLAPEAIINILGSTNATFVANFIAQHVYLRPEEKQELLEELRPSRRLAKLSKMLSREIEVLNLQRSLEEAAQERVNQAQQEYLLREQLKVIQSELGETDDTAQELDEYRTKIKALQLPQDSEERLLKEVNRLKKQPFGSSEASVIRNYLDVCLDLPWNVRTKETLDIRQARKILDEDHFGLEKVKDRVIEALAVRQLAPDAKGGVLCLVGPPGTGKTSIAMSIARATNRKLARISLGGVHDEAEIRGHRKTYVGAMPGRIVSGLQTAGSMNPVMVLDEIDKLGSDYRGDPSAALLEVLDAEQNSHFRDNFLEIPIDFSDIFFITTANTTQTIPRALLDRMEVIELSSYTDEEKLQIAKRHLLPKQRKKHGLRPAQLRISDDAIREIIALYTRESGVRVLERELAAICRKTAKRISLGECKSVQLRAGGVHAYLGPARYQQEKLYAQDEIGLVRGLAWTSVGGEVLDVEVGVVEGSGKLELTGNLGDVMKESARAAVTYIRSRAKMLGIDPDFYTNKDIHIHFPEGAVPKDGPSAGITICIAVISALTNTPVRRDLAMTGEITLRGRILPIGGLKEKTMAALRTGITTVIIPSENEKDLDEIDQTVRSSLNFITTDHVDKILDVALGHRFAASAPQKPPKQEGRSSENPGLNIRQ